MSVAGPAVKLAAGEQQGLRRNRRAVVEFEGDSTRGLRKDGPHEILHPQSGIDIPRDGGPACLPVGGGHTRGENRDIDHVPRLGIFIGILDDQADPARHRDCGRIPCPLQGRPPHRLGRHIKTKGPPVGLVERLHKNDGGIKGTIPVRPYPIPGETLGPDALHMLRQLGGRDDPGKPDPLKTGKPGANLTVLDIRPPFLPGDLFGSDKNPRAALGDYRVDIQPLGDILADLSAVLVEIGSRPGLFSTVREPPEPDRCGQHQRQHQIRRDPA